MRSWSTLTLINYSTHTGVTGITITPFRWRLRMTTDTRSWIGNKLCPKDIIKEWMRPPTLALSCVVKAETFSWDASSSRRSLRIWKRERVKKGWRRFWEGWRRKKEKVHMKRRGNTRDPGVCVVERKLCDLVSKRGNGLQVYVQNCTGGCKDHRDKRRNQIPPWIRPQFVFITGQWWWINMVHRYVWGHMSVVFANRKTQSSPQIVISPPSAKIERHSSY